MTLEVMELLPRHSESFDGDQMSVNHCYCHSWARVSGEHSDTHSYVRFALGWMSGKPTGRLWIQDKEKPAVRLHEVAK
jgi:hypothetical protein